MCAILLHFRIRNLWESGHRTSEQEVKLDQAMTRRHEDALRRKAQRTGLRLVVDNAASHPELIAMERRRWWNGSKCDLIRGDRDAHRSPSFGIRFASQSMSAPCPHQLEFMQRTLRACRYARRLTIQFQPYGFRTLRTQRV